MRAGVPSLLLIAWAWATFVNLGHAQTSVSKSKRVPIVSTTGCLTQVAADNWLVTYATDATVVTPLSSRGDEAGAPASATGVTVPNQTSGKNTYKLVGVDEFAPALHKNQTVLVKGLLIDAGVEKRINVTVLQMMSETCTPTTRRP
jgi:hypothetical protein